MNWFPLVLISAVCLAAADAIMKKYFSDYQAWQMVAIRFIVPAVFLLPVLWFYPLPDVPVEFWGWCALLVPLEIGAMLLYMLAIRDSPLYLTLPYMAFTPVLVVLNGYLMLGESVTLQGFSGILLVVSGGYFLNLNHFSLTTRWGWLAPLRAILYERGSRLMLIAAVIYSVTSVLSKKVMGYATPESFGAAYFALIGFVGLVAMVLYKPSSIRLFTQRPAASLAVGILMAVMVVTHFLAIATVEVAYMISVKRSSLLFGILFGAILFKEQHVTRHFIAGTMMVMGVILIVV